MVSRQFRVLPLTMTLILLLAAAARAEVPEPSISKAKLRFRRPSAAGPRDSLVIQGVVPGSAFAPDYEPTEDGFGLKIGDAVVVSLPSDEGEAKVKVKRSGARKIKLDGCKITWQPSGEFKLKVRRLDLSSASDESEVPLVLRVGASVLAANLVFYVASDRHWLYIAQDPWTDDRPPDDGWPDPFPAPTPDPGGGERTLIPWRVLARGRDSILTPAVPYDLRVVRDQPGWDALWTAHRGYGTPPSVDFAEEMVVGFFRTVSGIFGGFDGPEILCAWSDETGAVFRYLEVSAPTVGATFNSYVIVAATPVTSSLPITAEEKWLMYYDYLDTGVPPEWRDCR